MLIDFHSLLPGGWKPCIQTQMDGQLGNEVAVIIEDMLPWKGDLCQGHMLSCPWGNLGFEFIVRPSAFKSNPDCPISGKDALSQACKFLILFV